MTPELWELRPFRTLVWFDDLADDIDPLSDECQMIESLARELLTCEDLPEKGPETKAAS